MRASLGIWAALLSSIFSSVSVLFQVRSIQLLNAYIVSSLALILGAIFFFVFFKACRQFPSIQVIKGNIRPLLALVLLRCLIGNFLFVYSLSLTTGIKAMFFTKAEPYFVLFWGWVLKKGKVEGKHLILLLLHVLGAIFLSTGGDFSFDRTQIGDLLILVAMCCSSLSYFYGIQASQALGARVTNAVTQFCGGLILLPVAIFFSTPKDWDLSSVGWQYLLIHVLLFNVIALTLWFQSIKSVEAWIVSALRAVGPIVAAPLAWYFLNESLNTIQIISAIVILLTSALIAREHMVAKSKTALGPSKK